MKFLTILLSTFIIYSQQDTEVYLFDYSNSKPLPLLTNPKNISNNPGYDNQPSFSKNGKFIYFSSTRNGQTDILRFDIKNDKKKWISKTIGGEYSPQEISKNHLSAVRLDPDGKQLLYSYKISRNHSKVLVENKKIGYYAWINSKELLCFVLGEPNSLQLINLKSNESILVDEIIGRSVHKIPNSKLMSYISKKTDLWSINSFDPVSKETSTIISTVEGSEDLTWTNNGVILMSDGNSLFSFHSGYDKDWKFIIDFKEFDLTNISRISLDRENNYIAIVAEAIKN
tara:strand:+ start:1391 stop:2245 length:855 start_codon:yes stop_codon:yes gene_type:complete